MLENPIHASNTKDIISNYKYKGYYCDNKRKTIDYRAKKAKSIQKKSGLCIEIMKMTYNKSNKRIYRSIRKEFSMYSSLY